MLDSRAVLLLRIWMLLKELLDFAQDFIKSVNDAIKLENPGKSLSRTQCYWLSFCITAIILTNSVCWIRFEKISVGRFKASSLSWMFRRGKICWERLLVCQSTIEKIWDTSRHLGFGRFGSCTVKKYQTYRVYTQAKG